MIKIIPSILPLQYIRLISRRIINNELSIFLTFFLLAKFTLYSKIGFGYFEYIHPQNEFFPDYFGFINPFYCDLAILILTFTLNRTLILVGAALSFVQIIHPHSFGVQNYVVSFYLLIWLYIHLLNPSKPQILLGRMVISFIFAGAFIGKLTSGWISSDHPLMYLPHIKEIFNVPYLFVVGEFLIAISFLLPFSFGILVPLSIIVGMMISINFGIFDAVGPLIGCLLTLVIFSFHKKKQLTVYFDQNCGICMKVFRIMEIIGSNHIQLSFIHSIGDSIDENKALTYIASKDGENVYYGYETYCEIVSRLPLISFLYPVLKTKAISTVGMKIYLNIANSRTCKIS